METLISIILPTYNRGYTISSTIESVLNQTYINWELIVVDDGSQDDTDIIIEPFLVDSRIKYYSLSENHGANYCRNYGIKESKGVYIAFIDSDVIWKKEKLKKQTELIERNQSVDFVFCKTVLKRNGSCVEFPNINDTSIFNAKNLKQNNYIDTNTVLIKRETILLSGGFDENLPRLQEWELFIRLVIKEKCSFLFLKEILCENYINSDSISENYVKYCQAMSYIVCKHADIFINNELESFIVGKEKVYIYGAGLFGNCLCDYITDKYAIKVVFCVTEQAENSSDVVEIKQIKKAEPIVIGVGNKFAEEMERNLREKGYCNWIVGFRWD